MVIINGILITVFIIIVIAWICSLFYVKKSVLPMLGLMLALQIVNLIIQILN